MHAVQLARDFGMKRVIVPPAPGVFSATGLLLAEVSYDAARSILVTVGTDPDAKVFEALGDLYRDVRARAHADGLSDSQLRLDRFADMRYAGQSFELRVRIPDGAADRGDLAAIQEVFHRDHERMYGHALRDGRVVVVNVRVRVSDVSVSDEQRDAWLSGTVAPRSTTARQRDAYFGAEAGALSASVIRRSELRGGALAGPLIIEDPDSTTVIPPSASAMLGALGEIVIETGG
jgi:N-methylhydantoinase A